MHAFSVAVFLMGVSAVMAVPAHHEGDAMPPQTVGEAAQSIAGSAHVGAAVEGLLDHADQTKEWLADHGVEDDVDEDDWEEEDAEVEDDGEWQEEAADEMVDEAEDAVDEMPEEAKQAFGEEWTEESAEQVHESAALMPGEEDVEAEMPTDATYAMSYDAEGDAEAEMLAEGAPAVEGGAAMPEEEAAVVDAAAEGHMPVDNSTVSANATVAGAPANATAVAEKEMSCTISAAGYSPKEMTVKPGSKVSFKIDAEGEYSVKQTAGPTSCEALEGGFASKAMLKGDAWTYTVPQDAKGKMYMYSGPADKCDPTMLASITVGDNLVADNKAPSAAGTSGSTIGVSAAASVAPALASVAAAVVVAARSLF